MKALLEQPNGLARRVVAKAGADPTALLEKVDAYVRRQPRVSGDSGQVRVCCDVCVTCVCRVYVCVCAASRACRATRGRSVCVTCAVCV